jgi:hypothetical protein
VAGAAFAALMSGVALNALYLQTERHPAPLFDLTTSAPSTPQTDLRDVAATRTPLEEPPLASPRQTRAQSLAPSGSATQPSATAHIAATPQVPASQPPARAAASRQIAIHARPPEQERARLDAPRAEPPRPVARRAETTAFQAQRHEVQRPEGKKPEAKRPETKKLEAKKPDAVAALLRDGDTVGSITPTPRLASAQRALAKLGYDVKTDGVTGPSTRIAIEKFERQQGLPVTGALNSRTLRKLAIASGSAID